MAITARCLLNRRESAQRMSAAITVDKLLIKAMSVWDHKAPSTLLLSSVFEIILKKRNPTSDHAMKLALLMRRIGQSGELFMVLKYLTPVKLRCTGSETIDFVV